MCDLLTCRLRHGLVPILMVAMLVLSCSSRSRQPQYPQQGAVVYVPTATGSYAPSPPPGAAPGQPSGPSAAGSSGCGREPTAEEVQRAKGAFVAGMSAFDQADYHSAIDHWEAAYRLDCTAHALLLNLARAYELTGNRPAAARALRTYLAREPGTSRRAHIEQRIQRLEQP